MSAGKYVERPVCDWCGHSPAQSYPVEKRGTKTKRYAITVTACHACALRMGLADE